MHIDPLAIVIARDDVERMDCEPTLTVLRRLMASAEDIRGWRGKVDIAFLGYDQDRRELCEIPEVRNFVSQLDAEFPYWLFFLTRGGTGLAAIALCFLPPYLTDEGQRKIWPPLLRDLLERRWLPALAHLATSVGYSEHEIDAMISDAAHYLVEGPQLPFDIDAI